MGTSLLGSESITIVIVFAVVGSILGTVIEILLDNFSIPIPYTVLVFYVGVIIGFAIQDAGINTGDFFALSNVSAELILYGFLPTLLFSEAMTLNIHHLFQFFNQAAVLAGPGAVMICLMLGALAKGILPWGWSWEYSFLFGAILCATDPVSVVALLKSTKASSKLTMIVAGESLLNDGSAIILYLFFQKIVEGVTFDAATLIGFILEMLIVSPLLGMAFGFITARLMRRFRGTLSLNMDVQIVLSFVCAYVSFFVASYTLEISGVLCCCSAGLMISLFAPIRVVEDEKYHLMWHRAEWLCNTLIFLLAGFIGGSKASTSVNGESIIFLLIMFVILIATRLIMTFVLFPLLNYVGTEKVSVSEGLFATYAGLRGALGIALALEAANIASEADDSNANDIGQQIFFLVTGLASLTLLINGSTAGLVLVKLKLIDDPKAPISPQLEQVLLRIKLFMHKLLRDELAAMKSELGEYDELQLVELCSLVNANILPQLLGKKVYKTNRFLSLHSFFSTDKDRPPTFELTPAEMEGMNAMEMNRKSWSNQSGRALPNTLGNIEDDLFQERLSMRASKCNDIDHDLIAFIRQTFIDVVRSRYYHSLHTGKIGSGSIATRLLLYSTDVATDYIHEKLNDWETIKRYMHPNNHVLYLLQLGDDLFSYFDYYPGFVSRHDSFYERLGMYILTNYIDAHEYAQSRMHFFLGGPLTKEYNIAGPEQSMVMNESIELVKECRDLLDTIPADDLQKVYTLRAARMLTLKQTEIVQNIVNEGILSEKNAQYFFSLLQDESDNITLEMNSYMKEMTKRNVKDKINTEKQIREKIKKQQQGELEDGDAVMSPMAEESFDERPSFRKNLTGKDNLERLSNMSNVNRNTISSAIAMGPGVNISRAPPVAASTTTSTHSVGKVVSASSVEESSPRDTERESNQSNATTGSSGSSNSSNNKPFASPAPARLYSEESGLDEVELDNK